MVTEHIHSETPTHYVQKLFHGPHSPPLVCDIWVEVKPTASHFKYELHTGLHMVSILIQRSVSE